MQSNKKRNKLTWCGLTLAPLAGHQNLDDLDVSIQAGLTAAGRGNSQSLTPPPPPPPAARVSGSPDRLLSEEDGAEDLAQRPGAQQVLGAALAHSSEVAEQAVQGQPVLVGQAGGAGHAAQQLGAFLRVRHLC